MNQGAFWILGQGWGGAVGKGRKRDPEGAHTLEEDS